MSSVFFFILLTFTSFLSQSTQVHSLCSSQKFSNKKLYSNCTELPTLNSTLHFTFTPKNSTLSIAFTAPPATPNGWISWAINPTKTGMLGSQALIAFKDSNGSMVVKTYNISSYALITEGKILYEVVESSAEDSDGVMKLFATVKLPEKMMELNQVWQVGGEVKDGVPVKHGFLPGNLKAMGKLDLVEKKESNVTTAVAPSTNGASGVAGVYVISILFSCLLGLSLAIY